jgi:hypothetical protein
MSPLPFYDKHIILVAFLSVMLPALSCAIVLTLMEGVVKRYAKRKGEIPIDSYASQIARTIRRRTREWPRTGPGGNMAHGFRMQYDRSK